ncbi:MAG: helix-turn-helix domain-containing protein [Cellvibrionaceae bacterium]|nr:helix-turn-helix domain-containing protein [Cellvibrionaceae bacterium]
MHSNSTTAQRDRLRLALEQAGPKGITTLEAREGLDIMAPAPRIYELRHNYGYEIATLPGDGKNAQGNRHRCGRYVLINGPKRKRRLRK